MHHIESTAARGVSGHSFIIGGMDLDPLLGILWQQRIWEEEMEGTALMKKFRAGIVEW